MVLTRLLICSSLFYLSNAWTNVLQERVAEARLVSDISREKQIIRTLNYVPTVIHKNAAPPPPPGMPPAFPKSGTAPFDRPSRHPYEWDSIRSPEKMLTDLDGGSCGSFALSAAALLKQAGVPDEDMRIVSAVNLDDYSKICPGKAGEPRVKNPDTGASGHVFLLVKMGDAWELVNTSQNPFWESRDPQGPAARELNALQAYCNKNFPFKGENPFNPSGEKYLKCFESGRNKVVDAMTWGDVEAAKAESPESIQKRMSTAPTILNTEAFPTLRNWMGPSYDPQGMLVFDLKKLSEYPLHSFEDRFNYVASGDIKDPHCRWGAKDLQLSLQKQRRGLEAVKGPKAKPLLFNNH